MPGRIFTFHYASTLSNRVKMSGLIIPHLHSTMLLLYRSTSAGGKYFQSNLHSTMLLLYQSWQSCLTCFDLHLHSTMLLLYRFGCILVMVCFLLFTFHYASTLSTNHDHVELLEAHLHSTMLLLYPPVSLGVARRVCIYIPLCFYFI